MRKSFLKINTWQREWRQHTMSIMTSACMICFQSGSLKFQPIAQQKVFRCIFAVTNKARVNSLANSFRFQRLPFQSWTLNVATETADFQWKKWVLVKWEKLNLSAETSSLFQLLLDDTFKVRFTVLTASTEIDFCFNSVHSTSRALFCLSSSSLALLRF